MPEPYVIAVSVDRLDDRSFDGHLLHQIRPLYVRLRTEAVPLAASTVVIDLRRIRAIFPYALLGLLVLLQGLAPAVAQRIRVLLPAYSDAPECVRWISESGFIQAAQRWANVECDLPYGLRDDVYLIPVRPIATRQDYLKLIDELLEKVPLLLRGSFGEASCYQIVTVVSELCQNILSYARPELGAPGFAMLQAFKGIVKLAFVDAGPGIPATLRGRYGSAIERWDDSAVIAYALRAGVTSRNEGGGIGLYHLSEVIRKHNGILNIRSGRGKILLNRGAEHLYRARGLSSGPLDFWGTQVGVVLDRA